MQKVNSLSNAWLKEGALFLFTTLLVVALDQISKFWIRYALSTGEYLPDKGILRLTHTANTGAVFGLFASQNLSLIFSILALVAILSLCYYCYYYTASPPSRWGKVALGLMLGGGLGNMLDRLRFGYVTDFIDVRIYRDLHWPTFNLADSALLIGVIFLVYLLLFSRDKERQCEYKDTRP